MSTVVSTGQITLVDHNDAKPLVAFIGSSRGVSQVFTNNDGTNVYVPDWTSGGNQVLTAYVYAGGTTNIAANLANKKWATTPGGTSLGANATYTISTNELTEAAPTKTYYFEGDYSDPVTGLSTHILASITFTLTKKGDAAVFVQIEGNNIIQKSTGSTPGECEVEAKLYRNSGVDDTSAVQYKWYKIIGGTAYALVSGYSQGGDTLTNYVFKNAAGTTQSTPTDFNANVKKLVIKEQAVADIAIYRCDIKDTNTTTVYTNTFVVFDISDPIDVVIRSSAGDKFQNGVGSTNLSPEVWNGATKVTNLTGWSFVWTLYNKDGDRYPFIDVTKTPSDRAISSNTTTSFTIGTALASAPVAGDLIKVVSSDGLTIRIYEVGASSTTTVINIRITGLTNDWASTVAPTANQFQGGTLRCALASRSTSGATAITVTGDEIDTKGTVFCEASKPL